MIGEPILNYKVEAQLEENHLFRSYLAQHAQFQKKVVIKTITPKTLSHLDSERLLNELKRLSQIQHPNISTFYDYLEENEHIHLFFEYIEGRSLMNHILSVSGPIPQERAIPIFFQILEAIAYAHKKQIKNGALNSNHIYITPKKQIKILESALLPMYLEENVKLDDVEFVSFLSPEQIAGKLPDIRSDIYALGLILYQILTGTHPYSDFTSEQIKEKVLKEALPPMTDFYPMVDIQLQKIVEKALRKNPDERYPDCAAFHEALLSVFNPQVNKSTPTKKTSLFNQSKKSRPVKPVPTETRFINLPLFVLIGLVVLSAILYYQYQNPSSRVDSSQVVFDLEDTERIQRKQDSILRAKEEQRYQDSVRLVGNLTRKDTSQVFIHKVKYGETLQYLANRYFTHVDSLRKMNDMHQIPKDKKLEARYGMRVLVKDIYVIRENEGLGSVAAKYNVSTGVLIQANGIRDVAEEVFEGKKIVVPLIIR